MYVVGMMIFVIRTMMFVTRVAKGTDDTLEGHHGCIARERSPGTSYGRGCHYFGERAEGERSSREVIGYRLSDGVCWHR